MRRLRKLNESLMINKSDLVYWMKNLIDIFVYMCDNHTDYKGTELDTDILDVCSELSELLNGEFSSEDLFDDLYSLLIKSQKECSEFDGNCEYDLGILRMNLKPFLLRIGVSNWNIPTMEDINKLGY